MDTICLSMSMPRDCSLSICKVGHLFWYSMQIQPFCVLINAIYTGEAESGLERLHQCAEKELQIYLNAEGPSKDFNEFRTKLAGLTRYFFIYLE